MKSNKLTTILTVLVCMAMLYTANKFANIGTPLQNLGATTVSEQMRVVEVLDEHYEDVVYAENPAARSESIVLFRGEFTSGYKKGTTALAVQRVDSMYAIDIRDVSVGDRVVVYKNPDPSIDAGYMFAEFHRVPVLFVMIGIFGLLLIIFGRWQGFKTLISLMLTVLSIFWVFIPAVLHRKNIYLWAILTCVYIIFMTLLIVNGWTRKSAAAISGCVGGVLICGVIVLFCDLFLHMTGLTDENSLYLLMLDSENPISIKAVIFAAIIIGAVGAVMDVAMDISSALAEIKSQVPDISRGRIIKSGISIGRDIIGTMSNTLILAYIGSSLAVTLLMVAGQPSLLYLFNTEMIVVELLQAIAGSFGMLLTIPLTSVVCGVLYTRK